MLWLNGGPGCSSLFGLLEELGPFRIADNGDTVYYNEWTWNTISFLDKFPEYKGRDFYITGESYAGIYLPLLALHLLDDKKNFPNFKGMAIGNGLFDWELNARTLSPFLYNHGMLREEFYNEIKNKCCNGDFTTCPFPEDPYCYSMFEEVFNATAEVDAYNLYASCYTDGSSNPTSMRASIQSAIWNIGERSEFSADNNYLPLCAQKNNTEIYLNRADVIKALHVPSSLPNWTPCLPDRFSWYGFLVGSVIWPIETIVGTGTVKTLIYAGDVDSVCNHVGIMEFVTSVNKTILGSERVNQPWRYNEETPNVAGMVVQYEGNFDYLTVRGAGHFVPTDKPREALQMIYNWDEITPRLFIDCYVYISY